MDIHKMMEALDLEPDRFFFVLGDENDLGVYDALPDPELGEILAGPFSLEDDAVAWADAHTDVAWLF